MSSSRRDELTRALPYARRYARALTGSQTTGDRLVADGLREMLAAPATPGNPRHQLYAWVTRSFREPGPSTQAAGPAGGAPAVSRAGSLPETLSGRQRQLLLLTSLEEVSVEQAAEIVDVRQAEAATLLHEARERLRAAAAADVLIIEDEPIIAMDLEELVQSCGHRVVGVAASEREAVAIASRTRPGLILADINLGAGGDGASAVSHILQHHYAPVIFVTAYPERLLTGEAVEPAFVITKPFEPLTLAIATYQAVTGGVRMD